MGADEGRWGSRGHKVFPGKVASKLRLQVGDRGNWAKEQPVQDMGKQSWLCRTESHSCSKITD